MGMCTQHVILIYTVLYVQRSLREWAGEYLGLIPITSEADEVARFAVLCAPQAVTVVSNAFL